MEELLGVLDAEEKQYQILIELGGEKRDAVVKADIESLQGVTVREQEAASELLNLSNKRKRVLNDMAIVLGKDPETLTITKMIGYLEKQPKEQQQLAECKERLMKAGNQMHRVNEQNEMLLKQAMEMVDFDITLMKSMRQAPETANYDKNACNTGDLLGCAGFDARQ
jgi:flagellar biosynthesis/type III secretory pathway chaperone